MKGCRILHSNGGHLNPTRWLGCVDVILTVIVKRNYATSSPGKRVHVHC